MGCFCVYTIKDSIKSFSSSVREVLLVGGAGDAVVRTYIGGQRFKICLQYSVSSQ